VRERERNSGIRHPIVSEKAINQSKSSTKVTKRESLEKKEIKRRRTIRFSLNRSSFACLTFSLSARIVSALEERCCMFFVCFFFPKEVFRNNQKVTKKREGKRWMAENEQLKKTGRFRVRFEMNENTRGRLAASLLLL
jgi:hypothetical protein